MGINLWMLQIGQSDPVLAEAGVHPHMIKCMLAHIVYIHLALSVNYYITQLMLDSCTFKGPYP